MLNNNNNLNFKIKSNLGTRALKKVQIPELHVNPLV